MGKHSKRYVFGHDASASTYISDDDSFEMMRYLIMRPPLHALYCERRSTDPRPRGRSVIKLPSAGQELAARNGRRADDAKTPATPNGKRVGSAEQFCTDGRGATPVSMGFSGDATDAANRQRGAANRLFGGPARHLLGISYCRRRRRRRRYH
jgi:hypothetical protein